MSNTPTPARELAGKYGMSTSGAQVTHFADARTIRRIAELERDSKRLDWLLRHTEAIGKNYVTGRGWVYSVFFGDWYGPPAETKREAIDLAMKGHSDE